VGGILGLASAIGSITRIIGPITGAVLLDAIGAWAPGVFGALLVSWLLIYAWRYFSQGSGVSPLPGVEGERSRI
jgi:hypothetical protein